MFATETLPQRVHRSLALEIRSTWLRLTERDLDQVRTTQDLAAAVAEVYSVSLPQALHNVQAWAQGRRF